MCLWLLAACLNVAGPLGYPGYGGYGGYPYIYQGQIIAGVPGPILVPTAAPPPTNTTLAPLPPTTVSTATTTTLPPTPPGTLPTLPTTTAATTTTTTATTTTRPPNITFPTFPTLSTTTTTTARPTLPTFPPLPTLTPVPTNTTGITPPPGVIPTQQTFPPFFSIDPRANTPLPLINGDPAFRFGGNDVAYEDVVIEAALDYGIGFPGDDGNAEISFPRSKRQAVCGCYPSNQCPGTGTNTDGTGLIDFRIVTGDNTYPTVQPGNCGSGQRYCCIGGGNLQSCGSRFTTLTSYPVTTGQARYGDYPWMAVILTTDNQYVGGGTLIDYNNVITTAHRIQNYPNGQGIKIRLGEWDAAANYEQYPYRDFTIARIWVHESFNNQNLQNDIALIRLTGGLPIGTPAIIPICMPSSGQNFDGQRCWVSGWGKDNFGPSGRYQTILKAVEVPVISQASCESTMRTTRLGSAFILDRNSFICAGGEYNKDSCTGDGGSGLVCETSPGRWTLAGLVAWGLGCATQGVPAAYVNIVNYLPWINARVNA